MKVRLPVLLDSEGKERSRLQPTLLQLTLNLSPLSTAVMDLPPGEPEVTVGDFVRLYSMLGEAGIFRVEETGTDARGSCRVWLSHGLCTLSDHLVFEEQDFQGLDTGGDTGSVITIGVVTGKTVRIRDARSGSGTVLTTVHRDDTVGIRGAKGAWYYVSSGSSLGWVPKAYIQNTGEPVKSLPAVALALLDTQQPLSAVRWTLGSFEVERHSGCSFRQMNTLQALLSLPEYAEEACAWQFDQSVTPWRLNLVKLPDTVGCTLRLTQDLEALTLGRNRDDLCTRIYPVGKDGLTIEDGNEGLPYLQSDSAADWGVVERVYSDPQEDNAAALLLKAQRILEERSAPQWTVEAGALLREDQPLPQPGTLCRIILEDRVLEQRVTRLYWPDALHDPERVTLTLAAGRITASRLLNGNERWKVE